MEKIQIQVVSAKSMKYTAAEKAARDVSEVLSSHGYKVLKFCTYVSKPFYIRLPLVIKELIKLLISVSFKSECFFQYPHARIIFTIIPPPVALKKSEITLCNPRSRLFAQKWEVGEN